MVFLCVASLPVRLRAWPGGSWLPWRAVPCLLFACLRDLGSNGPVFSFTFSPAPLPQLNGPVQLHSLVVDKTVD